MSAVDDRGETGVQLSRHFVAILEAALFLGREGKLYVSLLYP